MEETRFSCSRVRLVPFGNRMFWLAKHRQSQIHAVKLHRSMIGQIPTGKGEFPVVTFVKSVLGATRGGYMGTVIRFPRHARASAAGLATEAGQAASSGHCSENQPITSSYLRAVKVFSLSSSRSKKRQSPAARRPRVAKLTDRAAAYADAQAMRLDRSSDSIAADNSRKLPTAQEAIGKLRLAEGSDLSDKTAMPTVDEVRRRLARAIESANEHPITVAKELGLDREYVRDFLTGRKASLSYEAMTSLAARYEIDPDDLKVGPRKRPERRRA